MRNFVVRAHRPQPDPEHEVRLVDETSAPHRFATLLFFLLVILTAHNLYCQEQNPDLTNSACLECHSDRDLAKDLPGGKTKPVFVDGAKFKASVHGENDCTSCHADITEIPHAENLKKVDCGSCHGDESDTYLKSTHGAAYSKHVADAPYCTTCHGKHDILPKSNPASKTHPLNQIQICTSCHLNPAIENKYSLPSTDKIAAYKTSVHGRGVLRSGLLVSATCVTCHSAHNVRPKNDPESTIYWSKIPKLCGNCHLGILEDFQESAHGKVWRQRSPMGPGCVTCHGSHGIEEPVTTSFQLHIPMLCEKCHAKNAPTYYDSFHGEAISLGFVRAATCANCHTPHRNLPASNPASTVNSKNLKLTCSQCHASVSAGFLTFDPHADPKNKNRSQRLYYVYYSMVILLSGVFSFFGLHTLLWLQRSIVAYFRGEFPRHHQSNGPYVMRFTLTARIIHAMIMMSFLGLAYTGLPLRFHYAHQKTMIDLIGGLEVSRFLHRFFAVMTFGYASYHIGHILYKVIAKKERGLLAGPGSMIPNGKDFKDLYQQIKWFLYLGRPARLDRYTYWEKFDYFAVFWGIPVIGLSGLMLWFPRLFTSFLPGYMLNIAKIIHSEEALLAIGFIFIFHFFHTHLRPEAFPMDLVMFTGRMPLERFQKERPEEYTRLLNNDALEKHLVDAPTMQQRIWGYIGGSIGLTTGILLIIEILISVFRQG